MKERLMKILVCPKEKSRLNLEVIEANQEEIMEGVLSCKTCGEQYKIVNGIPRFVSSEKYVGNFGYQWNKHRLTQLDNAHSKVSESTLKTKTSLAAENVKGKLLLDAGCGMGRFSDVVSRWGGEVVSIDLSTAVDAAYHNIGHRDNVNIIQADIYELPFREETFDIIFSIGVLMTTPDCKKAFMQLPKLLKQNGKVVIWIYSKHRYRGIDSKVKFFYRKITKNIPHKLLYLISHLMVIISTIKKGNFGRLLHAILPGIIYHAISGSSQEKYIWRVLDIFDFYSPKYVSTHSYPEVYSWFKENKLDDIELLDYEISISGIRKN